MRTADVVVIGGGPGGYPAAIRAAQRGAETVLIDPGPLGGVCLNEGCIPSKGLLDAAAIITRTRALVDCDIDLDLAFTAAQRRNTDAISRMNTGIEGLLQANGVKWIRGLANFVGPSTVKVGSDTICFGHAIIATGSKARTLAGLGDVRVIDAKGALELTSVPDAVLVAGAGAIGLELATVLRRFGAAVTVVELEPRALIGIDSEHASILVKSMQSEGIRFAFGSSIAAGQGGLSIRTGEASEAVEAQLVVAAVGRSPLTVNLGLESAAVDVDEHGFVQIDERCTTSNQAVLAVGDVTAGPGFAHRATAQALVAADVCAGHNTAFAPMVIPSIVYTDPQVVSVGHTRQTAGKAGYDVLSTRLPMAANGRNNVTNGGGGEVLLVSDATTSLILGVHAVGHDVEALAPAAVLALELGALVQDLARSIFAHPTIGEMLSEAAHLVEGVPIHAPQRHARVTASL